MRRRQRRRDSSFGGVIALVLALALPTSGAAQEERAARQCTDAVADAEAFCRLVVQAFDAVQPRVGLALAGGNPVPGTASTLGMRIGTLPRLSLSGRLTGVWADAPDVRERDSVRELDAVLPVIGADVAVGLFGGVSPAPTVGGVGSIDLLTGAGLLFLPGDQGFVDDVLLGGAIGARVGILRESFTLPGISVSARYGRTGDVLVGDRRLERTDSFFELGSLSAWSFRAAVSKRLLLLGLTLGAGYDRYSSDVTFGVSAARATAEPLVVSLDDYETDRLVLFGNLSWTVLILHLVGEVGWQSGGEFVPGSGFGAGDFDAEAGAFFGTVALRISI